MVARLNGVQEAASSTLVTRTISEQGTPVPIFLYFKVRDELAASWCEARLIIGRLRSRGEALSDRWFDSSHSDQRRSKVHFASTIFLFYK